MKTVYIKSKSFTPFGEIEIPVPDDSVVVINTEVVRNDKNPYLDMHNGFLKQLYACELCMKMSGNPGSDAMVKNLSNLVEGFKKQIEVAEKLINSK